MVLAANAIAVAYDSRGFNADELLSAMRRLDLSQFIGCVYGSGFEAQPELLQKISALVPLIGNQASIVRAVKNATMFFGALDELNVKHPKTFYGHPDEAGDGLDSATAYLIKLVGGSGGEHVAYYQSGSGSNSAKSKLLDGYYRQQYIEGVPISLLFIASARETNGHKISVVGFNEQWIDASDSSPFRYGGAVSNIAISESLRKKLIDAAVKITNKFGLLGLNSVDAIWQKNTSADEVYMLEVNPRLSATVGLYDSASLFEQHIEVCLSQIVSQPCVDLACGCSCEKPIQTSKAHAIVYADGDLLLSPDIVWPDWVTDTPLQQVEVLLAGSPVCSVVAEANDATQAKMLVQSRVTLVKNLLSSNKVLN